MVTRHLIYRGHKKIGVICGKEDNMHTIERLKGYRSALSEFGIKYDKDLVLYGDWERESGRICARKLLSMGITTIWCMNDLMAAGAYDEAMSEGLIVGEDISVFGFDNREISEYLFPQLSTCELPLEAIGKTCAEQIIKEIEDESYRNQPAELIKMPCMMVQRKSVI